MSFQRWEQKGLKLSEWQMVLWTVSLHTGACSRDNGSCFLFQFCLQHLFWYIKTLTFTFSMLTEKTEHFGHPSEPFWEKHFGLSGEDLCADHSQKVIICPTWFLIYLFGLEEVKVWKISSHNWGRGGHYFLLMLLRSSGIFQTLKYMNYII